MQLRSTTKPVPMKIGMPQPKHTKPSVTRLRSKPLNTRFLPSPVLQTLNFVAVSHSLAFVCGVNSALICNTTPQYDECHKANTPSHLTLVWEGNRLSSLPRSNERSLTSWSSNSIEHSKIYQFLKSSITDRLFQISND